MGNKLTVLLLAGARPNFMKVAPLMRAIDKHNAKGPSVAIDCKLVHSGQHYDAKMSDVFFQELGIRAPDVNLEVGSGSHATQTANVMLRFEPVCLRENPDWVVVVGDVNSTVACALVASKLRIRIAHVEAGLRSFDRSMPEEINRLVTDAISDLLLTPSEDGNDNLAREGIPDSKVRLVGNIMIDALVTNLPAARARSILKDYHLERGRFAYVTLHRPANVDCREVLVPIFTQLQALSQQLPVIFPIHPRTRKMLAEFGLSCDSTSRLQLIEPVGYHDSLCLTENARLVLTDSGGLQEEATVFRTPCLTLRPNTERPITITLGSNRLSTAERLAADIEAVLRGPERIGKVPALWDGNTAERIVQALLSS
jgi:UDP-N-acetylglucosamine 2-epimerase (non-hydrolysing)